MQSVNQLVNEANVGVLGYITKTGRPMLVAVTPYLVGNQILVTSTAAYTDKGEALRADARVVLAVDGVTLSGVANVSFDSSGWWFNEHLRQQEAIKYPPARSLFSIPGHRKLFPWYFQRFVIEIDVTHKTETDVSHRNTLLGFTESNELQLVSLVDVHFDTHKRIALPAAAQTLRNDHASLLIHEEHGAMSDLRQLRHVGTISNLNFVSERTIGSLEPKPTSLAQQIRMLNDLRRKAKANEPKLTGWQTPSFRS